MRIPGGVIVGVNQSVHIRIRPTETRREFFGGGDTHHRQFPNVDVEAVCGYRMEPLKDMELLVEECGSPCGWGHIDEPLR